MKRDRDPVWLAFMGMVLLFAFAAFAIGAVAVGEWRVNEMMTTCVEHHSPAECEALR